MATWHTGQAWRVAHGLDVLRDQIRAWAPRSVPPATDVNAWGSIADNVHATSSDHYPHWLWDADQAIVCARDFPHAPGLGLDSYALAEHLRQARDPRVQYVISNHRITGVSYGWQWSTYTGDDPHDTHIHVSVKRSSVSDGTQPWSLPGGTTAAVAASSTEGESMSFPILQVTSVPAAPNNTDIRGKVVPEHGLAFATPNGLVGVTSAWWGSMNPDAPANAGKGLPQPVLMGVTWTEAHELCDALEQSTTASVDASAVATALVADPAFGDLIEARALAAAQRAEDS